MSVKQTMVDVSTAVAILLVVTLAHVMMVMNYIVMKRPVMVRKMKSLLSFMYNTLVRKTFELCYLYIMQFAYLTDHIRCYCL